MQPSSATLDPAPGAVEPAVESVVFALMSIGRLLRTRMQGDGVDPATFWLLKGLAAHEALRVTELAALANLDASTVSRHVAQLDRSGWIERSPDPADGRAQRVAISPAGRELLHRGFAQRRALLSRGLSGWSDDDIEAFGRLLDRFVRTLDDTNDDNHNENDKYVREHR